ncbi:hypothetical protein C4D60_Mb07t20540 [Musa balbisiana]|uniref:Transmembrane protein n=1 Tax=Musa balbisiana TaxID=52838 RepID=A0A4S8JGR5_MUSBA|nr:hypothetical protein C4D60_Mb07t20540 [Musa balbisiana]
MAMLTHVPRSFGSAIICDAEWKPTTTRLRCEASSVDAHADARRCHREEQRSLFYSPFFFRLLRPAFHTLWPFLLPSPRTSGRSGDRIGLFSPHSPAETAFRGVRFLLSFANLLILFFLLISGRKIPPFSPNFIFPL